MKTQEKLPILSILSNDVRRIIAKAIGRKDRIPATSALATAERVIEKLLQAEENVVNALGKEERVVLFIPMHVGIGQDENVTITFCHKRKLVSYECDTNGDVLFLLSDRSSAKDPSAELLTTHQIAPSYERVREFLMASEENG